MEQLGNLLLALSSYSVPKRFHSPVLGPQSSATATALPNRGPSKTPWITASCLGHEKDGAVAQWPCCSSVGATQRSSHGGTRYLKGRELGVAERENEVHLATRAEHGGAAVVDEVASIH